MNCLCAPAYEMLSLLLAWSGTLSGSARDFVLVLTARASDPGPLAIVIGPASCFFTVHARGTFALVSITASTGSSGPSARVNPVALKKISTIAVRWAGVTRIAADIIGRFAVVVYNRAYVFLRLIRESAQCCAIPIPLLSISFAVVVAAAACPTLLTFTLAVLRVGGLLRLPSGGSA